MTSPSPDIVPREQLLARLLEGVKGCQSRFGSRTELATEDDDSIKRLCLAFENVFLHGVKGPDKARMWQLTENLVPSGLRLPTDPVSFWPLIKSQLSKHESERFLLLHNVRTDFGRGRAWLRASLNEHSLERYILIILSLENLQHFYEPWAFLRDPELSTILPQTAAGLGSVLFALVVDNPILDSSSRPIVKEDIVASPVEVAEIADQFLSATKKDNASLPPKDDKRQLKKKKKKLHVNVVSFDDDDDQRGKITSSHQKPNKTSPSSSTATTPTPTATPTPQKVPVSRTSSNQSTSSPVQIKLPTPEPPKESSNSPAPPEAYSSSLNADCISINSVYSDCSEHLDLDNVNLSFGIDNSTQRLKPLRNNQNTRSGDGESDQSQDPDSSSHDLIPVPNFDPVVPAMELQLDLDRPYSPSPLATPVSAPTSERQQWDNKSIRSFTSARISLSSIMGDESDEDRVQKLKVILDREIETVATLQAQLADEKRRNFDQIKIFEARVENLSKDNEILKHQLNKYIGAVQLLKKEGLKGKKGSFEEDEELINEALGVDNNDSEQEPADESAEYERKLIQVAEMHGELMEFNSHLQTSLRKRDLVIKRLREELVDLRGPLATPLLIEDGGGGFEEDSWDIVDSSSNDSRSSTRRIALTHNERVLINIWIPSAFLTGANTDLHHVYQIFIRIKDTEWNVYRRYSQFYSLHRDLKKRDGVIGSYYFPPKKHLGNKDGKFVDERRRKLQDYLRKVMNHTLQTNSILAAHPDKNLLISIFPFFGESSFSHTPQKPKKERSRSRNLFFLPSNQSHTVQNSSSGLQAQMNTPQYTGL